MKKIIYIKQRRSKKPLLLLAVIVFLFLVAAKAYTGTKGEETTNATISILSELEFEELKNSLRDDEETSGYNIQKASNEKECDIYIGYGDVPNGFANNETLGKIDAVLIANFTSGTNDISKDELGKIFSGSINSWKDLGEENQKITRVVKESNGVIDPFIRESIGIDNADIGYEEERPSWKEVCDYVAENKGSLAIIPFKEKNVKTKEITIDGASSFEKDGTSVLSAKLRCAVNPDKNDKTGLLSLSPRKYREEMIKNVLSSIKDRYIGEKDIFEICAVGDIMLSRHVGTKIRESKDNAMPFRKTSDMTSEADITFGNLESPFYDQGPPVTEGMTFKAEPETIEGLLLGGFDVVSLANNHFGNQQRKGMQYTFDFLKKNNITYTGAGNDYDEAHQYKIIEREDTKVAFLSYNEIAPKSYAAAEDTPGVAWMEDPEKIKDDIKKAQENSDIVFVSFHWGTEYKPNASENQIDYGHLAIDNGADLVIAQHPHVVQGLEFYKDGFIAYSLGNFVFDQMWSEETREGVIANLTFNDRELTNIELVPITIQNYSQPQLSNGTNARSILERIYKASIPSF